MYLHVEVFDSANHERMLACQCVLIRQNDATTEVVNLRVGLCVSDVERFTRFINEVQWFFDKYIFFNFVIAEACFT